MKTSDVSRMSIRQKVGSVLNRNPTSLEAEREQAIQNFFITLQKVSFRQFFKRKRDQSLVGCIRCPKYCIFDRKHFLGML